MPVEMRTLGFPSADGESNIGARLWVDTETKPKAILQIAHGMAEHIDRYDEFARFLASRGIAVCGNNHIGHGDSVSSKSQWGHMPMGRGKGILIADMHTLRSLTSQQLGSAFPYFMFGHSMGSFALRCYLAQHASELAGAVICGTGNLPVATSKAGNALCRLIGAVRGETYRSKLVDGMAAGGYNKMIKNPRTPVDWLSFSTENVDAYIEDERCGFMFTVGGYEAVTSMSAESAEASCAACYPNDLPLLYIAGKEDPVGGCGKGVLAAAQLARDAGAADVTTFLYEGMRHEILKEGDRVRVIEDVADWLQARI